MKPAEIRDLTTDEIIARIEHYQSEIFRLRFRSATQELENPMLLRTLRRAHEAPRRRLAPVRAYPFSGQRRRLTTARR